MAPPGMVIGTRMRIHLVYNIEMLDCIRLFYRMRRIAASSSNCKSEESSKIICKIIYYSHTSKIVAPVSNRRAASIPMPFPSTLPTRMLPLSKIIPFWALLRDRVAMTELRCGLALLSHNAGWLPGSCRLQTKNALAMSEKRRRVLTQVHRWMKEKKEKRRKKEMTSTRQFYLLPSIWMAHLSHLILTLTHHIRKHLGY